MPIDDSTRAEEYSWHWVDGEDRDVGNSWIQISDPDGEEIAVIMCRDYDRVRREHPEWIASKEIDAQIIVDALDEYQI